MFWAQDGRVDGQVVGMSGLDASVRLFSGCWGRPCVWPSCICGTET